MLHKQHEMFGIVPFCRILISLNFQFADVSKGVRLGFTTVRVRVTVTVRVRGKVGLGLGQKYKSYGFDEVKIW